MRHLHQTFTLKVSEFLREYLIKIARLSLPPDSQFYHIFKHIFFWPALLTTGLFRGSRTKRRDLILASAFNYSQNLSPLWHQWIFLDFLRILHKASAPQTASHPPHPGQASFFKMQPLFPLKNLHCQKPLIILSPLLKTRGAIQSLFFPENPVFQPNLYTTPKTF